MLKDDKKKIVKILLTKSKKKKIQNHIKNKKSQAITMTENCSVSMKAVVVIFSSYVGCQMGYCKGRAAAYYAAAVIAQPNRPIWVQTISLISQIFQTKTMDQLKMMPVSAALNHKRNLLKHFLFLLY